MTPHRTPSLLPLLFPSLIWRMPSRENELFLTFDDGPVPGPTEFVLDELSRHQFKATFFCIGDNVKRYPEIFKRIVREGHMIGNHTFHHINGWKSDNLVYTSDVEACQQEFDRHSAVRTTLFRPPYGRITPKQVRLLAMFKIIMWDVLSVDYNQRLGKESCLRNTLNAVRPGSIIVFHDSYKAERNMMFTLPRLIEACKEKGYSFKPIAL